MTSIRCWFGIIFIVTAVEIGLITPPIGVNLFVIDNVAKDLKTESVICDIVRITPWIGFPMLATRLSATVR